jgi:phage shock protein C
MQPTSPESAPPSRLHRSVNDRVIAGVCGGVAEAFDIDPILVRLAFIVAALWGGIGVLAYLVLLVVLPAETDAAALAVAPPKDSANIAGGLLIAAGALLLFANLGLAPWLSWHLFWPTVLIVIGAALLLRRTEVTT